MLLIMAPFLAVGIAICVTDVISHIWGNAAILTSLSTMGRIVWAEHRSRRNPRRELSSRRPISADSATKDA